MANKAASKKKHRKESLEEVREHLPMYFEKFWKMYDKKVDRAKCEKKFNKLKAIEIENIYKTLPNYVKSTPDKKYRKNPLTYLNGKCWQDEIFNTKEETEKHSNDPNEWLIESCIKTYHQYGEDDFLEACEINGFDPDEIRKRL